MLVSARFPLLVQPSFKRLIAYSPHLGEKTTQRDSFQDNTKLDNKKIYRAIRIKDFALVYEKKGFAEARAPN
jgi:hypothetical protein